MASLPCHNILKVHCLFNGPGEAVLRFVLKCGTNIPANLSLIDYLNNLPQDSMAYYKDLSEDQKKRIFNEHEKRRIAASPSWDRFDTSLLYKAIKFACEDLDRAAWRDNNRLEGLISQLKNMRNRFIHDKPELTGAQFQAIVEEVEDILMRTLEAARTKYSVSDADIVQEKANVARLIREVKQFFTLQDLMRFTLAENPETIKNYFLAGLRKVYRDAVMFDPLYFFIDSRKEYVDVQEVFTKILIKEQTKRDPLNYEDILVFAQSLGHPKQPIQATQPPLHTPTHPELLLITGEAGSGKTTLLDFIVSDWMKDKCDRQMRSINSYDLVLHITCRERTSGSLEKFLSRIFPQPVNSGVEIVVYLQQFRTLFLIDGLDECNNSSTCLVKDILQYGIQAPDTTIVCTSRPDVSTEFLHSLPEEYRKACVEIEGVDTMDRTTFVLRYYDQMGGVGSSHRERLAHITASVGWRDQKLPLNLVFLAIFFKENPENVRENSTQTILCNAIHSWILEKLHGRLVRRRMPGDPTGILRDWGVDKVMDEVYKVSLRGLLEERSWLSHQDMNQLRHCCREEGLPLQEIVGSFFTLSQAQIAGREVHEDYYAAHKGFQDYFGALHVFDTLIKDSDLEGGAIGCTSSHAENQPQEHNAGAKRKMLQGGLGKQEAKLNKMFKQLADRSSKAGDKPQKDTGAIRMMLQNCSGTQLVKFRKLLLHILDLIKLEDRKPCLQLVKECVDLLAESGIETCNSWLSLLQDTQITETAFIFIAEHITGQHTGGKESVKISDTTIRSASALLPQIPGKDVWIELHRKPTDLLELVHDHHTYMGLHLYHHYQHPHQAAVSDALLAALPTSHLEVFMGHLSADGILTTLSHHRCLKELFLAVSDDQTASEVVSAISSSKTSWPDLEHLYLHVPVPVLVPAALTTRLPDITDSKGDPGVSLVLSGVDNTLLDKTIQIAAALQPPGDEGYYRIRFPGNSLGAEAWQELLDGLGRAGVRMVGPGAGGPDTSPIIDKEVRELNTLATTMGLGRNKEPAKSK